MSIAALFVLGFVVAWGVSYYPGAFFRYIHLSARAHSQVVDFFIGLILAGFSGLAAGALFFRLVTALKITVIGGSSFTLALLFTVLAAILCVLVAMRATYTRIRRATRFMLMQPEHPGSRWIEAHYRELRSPLWVAADQDGLLAFDCRVEVVLAQLEDLGIKSENFALGFLE